MWIFGCSSLGGNNRISNGLNARIAAFYLPVTALDRKPKIALFGSRNGLLSDKLLRHYPETVAIQKIRFREHFMSF